MEIKQGDIAPVDDPTSTVLSLSRIPDGRDTDDNAVDFQIVCRSAGLANNPETDPALCTTDPGYTCIPLLSTGEHANLCVVFYLSSAVGLDDQ